MGQNEKPKKHKSRKIKPVDGCCQMLKTLCFQASLQKSHTRKKSTRRRRNPRRNGKSTIALRQAQNRRMSGLKSHLSLKSIKKRKSQRRSVKGKIVLHQSL